MPELPEVERGRRLAEEVARGRRIERVICARDSIVYEGVSPRKFQSALLDRQVLEVRRRGKHIWFELDERPWPLFHFGMTGAVHVPGRAALRLASSPREMKDTWPPRFTKCRIVFSGGTELAMTNARRLGRIRLRDDPLAEKPLSGLGFDPLLDLPSPGKFTALLERRGCSLKGLLLDQTFAAGVGNWIADEVLYQARLDPRRRVPSLEVKEIRRLRSKLGAIVRTAVRANAEKHRLPRAWLFHHRWGKDAGARTSRGEPIHHITVAGRTTAWVPSAQQ